MIYWFSIHTSRSKAIRSGSTTQFVAPETVDKLHDMLVVKNWGCLTDGGFEFEVWLDYEKATHMDKTLNHQNILETKEYKQRVSPNELAPKKVKMDLSK